MLSGGMGGGNSTLRRLDTPWGPRVVSRLLSLLRGVGPTIYNSTHKGSEENVLALGSKAQKSALEKLRLAPWRSCLHRALQPPSST